MILRGIDFMSFTLIDNRVRFSSSHPARKPFIKPKQGLGDTFCTKGTGPKAGSHGDLKKLPELQYKLWSDRQQQEWFNTSIKSANSTSRR